MTAPSQTPEAAGLVELIQSRIGQDFEGECHLTDDEARSVVAHLVTAASAQAAIDAEKAKVAELEALVASYRKTADLEAQGCDAAEARADRAEARIAELAALFGVCDGGRYLNDWKARADRLAKALKETRNRVREWPIDDHETCMCGSPVASHGMGDGHSPVSQGDHAISMIVEAINEALQQETQK